MASSNSRNLIRETSNLWSIKKTILGFVELDNATRGRELSQTRRNGPEQPLCILESGSIGIYVFKLFLKYNNFVDIKKFSTGRGKEYNGWPLK